VLREGVWTLLFLILAARGAAAAAGGTIELISKADPIPDTDGNVPFSPVVSADGRYVAFNSDAPNLVPGQINGSFAVNVFLRDRVAGTTTLVSHAAGQPSVTTDSNGFFDVSDDSFIDLGISASGQYVVFATLADGLVPGQVETNPRWNVFLYDRNTGINTLVSHVNGQPEVTGDESSFDPQISADGNWITFTSHAGNLVAGQIGPPTRSGLNLFLYHRPSGTLTLISHQGGAPATTGSGNALHSRISADGSLVVFDSIATDLIPGVTGAGASNVFSYATASGAVSLVSHMNGAPLTATGGGFPQVSADGRWVAFQHVDVFLQDRVSGQTQLVSHRSSSPSSGAGAEHFALSADGGVVAFLSTAADLVPGQVDTNGAADLFAWSRLSGATTLVTHTAASRTTASKNPVILPDFGVSADGRFIAFASGAGDLVSNPSGPAGLNVFLYDRTAQTSVLVSHTAGSLAASANGDSFWPLISADGGSVLFNSFATDLGAGQIDLNQFLDVFAYDRRSAEVAPVSQRDPESPMATPHGPSWPEAISADGKTILFTSLASGLVPGYAGVPNTLDVFLHDRSTGKTVLLSQGKNGPPVNFGGPWPALSADGSFAAFGALDKGSNGAPLVSGLYLYDRAANATSLLNHAPGSATEHAGYATTPSLSADGRYVVFNCARCNVVPGMQAPASQDQPDVFLYDRAQNVYTLVSHASGSPLQPADGGSNGGITPGGRFILFSSSASNLVAGLAPPPSQSSNLFLFDRTTGTTTLVSHAAGNSALPANGISFEEKISADGRWIAFTSTATDLVTGQQAVDGRLFALFLYDRTTGTTSLVDHAASSQTPANGEIERWSMSDDGRWIGFGSEATDLIAGLSDTNENSDVFLYDRDSATTTLISHAEGAPNTTDGNGGLFSQLSADGSRIAFQSPAPKFRSGPPIHLILQDRATGARTDAGETYPRTYINPILIPLNLRPQMSASGHQIAFTSFSPLVPGDFNGDWDAYAFDDSGSSGGPGPGPTFPCTALDAPGLRSNVRQVFSVTGPCGVPATAKQVTVKVTVSAATGKGTVQLYPGNVNKKPPGTLRFQRGQTASGTFNLPPATNGAGTLALLPTVASHGTVHVVVEVEGFTP
jgi:Tol biopolymer transport system component